MDHELSREAFEENPPFKAMHIRVREQIVADGFDKPLNWNSAGREMPG
jgi:predicted sulfurtransferase